jgi:hypothetical protein
VTPIPRRPANYHLERKVIEPLILASVWIVLDPLRYLSKADPALYKEVKELLFDHLELFELDDFWVICDRSNNKDPSQINIVMKVRYNPGESIVSYAVVIRLRQP